jgi:hypothetical protein
MESQTRGNSEVQVSGREKFMTFLAPNLNDVPSYGQDRTLGLILNAPITVSSYLDQSLAEGVSRFSRPSNAGQLPQY